MAWQDGSRAWAVARAATLATGARRPSRKAATAGAGQGGSNAAGVSNGGLLARRLALPWQAPRGRRPTESKPAAPPESCCRRQEAHIARLRRNLDTGGDASLQNALDLAVDSLRSIPPYGHRRAGAGQHGAPRALPYRQNGHRAALRSLQAVAGGCGLFGQLLRGGRGVAGHCGVGAPHCSAAQSHLSPVRCREVLFMLAALSTCDPGDIGTSIKAAKQHRVRVSGALPLPSARRRQPWEPAACPAVEPRSEGYSVAASLDCSWARLLPRRAAPAYCTGLLSGGSGGLPDAACPGRWGHARHAGAMLGLPGTSGVHMQTAAPAFSAVVGLAAEMFVCRRMTQQTGGTYTGGWQRPAASAPSREPAAAVGAGKRAPVALPQVQYAAARRCFRCFARLSQSYIRCPDPPPPTHPAHPPCSGHE